MASKADRWRARPVLGSSLRAVVFVLPIAAAAAASAGAAQLLPAPVGLVGVTLWWIGVITLSVLALVVVDRALRLLLPLAALLRLSILFPDRAPSRLAVARRAGRVRDLRKQLEEARERGLDDQPTRAAETILSLVAALAWHDRQTRGHSERVRAFVDLLADELKLLPGDRDRLRWAALLHDIGKLAVSAEILNSPGSPGEDAWAVLHRHPAEGARLAAPLLPWLGRWGATIEHHHEKYDGTGYPRRLAGEEISLGGRIVAVADSYDTMTAARPYKKPMGAAVAREELARCAGTHFDPRVVRAFLNISIGRLWRRIGLVSWLASVPFLPQPAIAAVHRAGRQAAMGAAAVTAAVAVGIGSPVLTLSPGIDAIAAPAPGGGRPTEVDAVTIDEVVSEEAAPSADAVEAAGGTVAVAGRRVAEPSITIAGPPTPVPEAPLEESGGGRGHHGECVSNTAQERPDDDDSDGDEESGRGDEVSPVAQDKEKVGDDCESSGG